MLGAGFGKGKNGVLTAIEHLGYVQIDTLSVVARAHHHTLWSRLPDYAEAFLNELLEKDKTIFEYWSHAASYLPMCDYRFSLPRKQLFASGKSHWFEQDKKLNQYVLDRIKAEGPLQSKDFEHKRTSPGNWYEWKPAKKALEQLFMQGDLMVAKRQGFQKVYDIAERVLPKKVNTSTPTEQEYAKHLIKKTIQAHGLVDEAQITYLRPKAKKAVTNTLKELVENNEIVEISIENQKNTFYSTKEQLSVLNSIKPTENIHFLSPFDNAVIQRKRLQTLFNYDYQIECYVPEAKRKFGYFCLPILYNNQFVGRFDPKADRKTKTFHVKQLYFENGFKPDAKFNTAFTTKLNEFAAFNGCNKVVLP
ncbi:MAG: YcaQ family DNA glycosylase [Flavobacteriales bacterium]|nr:YcaQ family DNA glycosylase [Flavobacteriales bacterium]MCB9175247.1 YcaQ family DNA glycosylase [Flavobacteriales bacterium]